MAISLQADSTLPQGYILVDGQRAATISTTGLSATLANGLVTTSALASGAVTTEKIASGSITAEKMSGGQTGSAPIYGCRAWVNFSGIDAQYHGQANLGGTATISVTAGNNFGFWTDTAANYSSAPYLLGVRYWLPVLNGVAGGLLGGADVSSPTNAIQFTEIISSTRLKFKFTNNQIPLTDASVSGNNTTNFQLQSYGIRESGNVASVVRNGPGDYTINFATSMPDAFYCMTQSVGDVDSVLADDDGGAHPFTKTLSSARVYVGYGKSDGNIQFADYDQIDLAFFR